MLKLAKANRAFDLADVGLTCQIRIYHVNRQNYIPSTAQASFETRNKSDRFTLIQATTRLRVGSTPSDKRFILKWDWKSSEPTVQDRVEGHILLGDNFENAKNIFETFQRLVEDQPGELEQLVKIRRVSMTEGLNLLVRRLKAIQESIHDF
jgi:hypothetical protein